MSAPRYRLVFNEPDGTSRTADFTSTTGRLYDVGDELELDSGERWRVAEIREADAPHLATLVCERV